nr:retrovirus-related Pol polyprotein from transposon TNT 1-94 [Tanacetum cinerariifolium]
MDEVFKDQDLALILLGSLPEEYELLETTLLNGKDDVSLSEVCVALYSKVLRRKDKHISSSGDDEVLLVRGHWKRDCPRLKTKGNHYKGKVVAEANVTKCDDEELNLSLATSSRQTKLPSLLMVLVPFDYIMMMKQKVTLKCVRYSPKLKKNLISVGTSESKGFEVRSNDGVMKIIYGVLVIIKDIHKINNTYHYKGRIVVGAIAAVTEGDKNLEVVNLWHIHLGHAGKKSLNLLIKQGLLKGLSSCNLDLYEHCINGKTTRTRSLRARHYYVTFVDDFSQRVWVYTLRTKDEVLGVFIKWKKMMETQTCRKIKHLRTNNGREFKNDLFIKFCEDEGVIRHFTVRNTPQQNEAVKRINRTLLEKIWCVLSNAGLGKEFWVEAVTYACHHVNCFPSTAIDKKTPFEKWYGKPAIDYDSLHVFGSAAYYHVKKSKLYPRAKKALFMGITSGIKGYRLWC